MKTIFSKSTGLACFLTLTLPLTVFAQSTQFENSAASNREGAISHEDQLNSSKGKPPTTKEKKDRDSAEARGLNSDRREQIETGKPNPQLGRQPGSSQAGATAGHSGPEASGSGGGL